MQFIYFHEKSTFLNKKKSKDWNKGIKHFGSKQHNMTYETNMHEYGTLISSYVHSTSKNLYQMIIICFQFY